MTDRPILFSAPMVRAILAGTKTQTRRAFPVQPPPGVRVGIVNNMTQRYGGPGDRLWVREAWRTTGCGGRADDMPPRDLQPHPVWYVADGTAPVDECCGKVRPGMFMPRWASRITLNVTGVRVERLKTISHADAVAEGMAVDDAVYDYMKLWQTLNGPESWDANPWVWVVEFKRAEA